MAKKGKRKDKSNHSDKVGSRNQLGPKTVEAEDATSLAQRLKKHRGVAANTPPPTIYNNSTGKPFLTPHQDPAEFEECLNTSYKGFCYDSPSELPNELHQQFDTSFRGMEDLFLYDTIQPGKKRLTRTSVTRTLVGNPGSSYKYLGLRLFSHPWVDVDKDGNAIHADKPGSTLRKIGYPTKTAAALIEMGRANDYLKERSNQLLEKHVSPNVEVVGSADYNLTLINKMDSFSKKRDLKKESAYGMGKVSVGWHRDSGLKDFSSIAVYQSLQGVAKSATVDGWGVALRAMDGGTGGPLANVPALCVPLPSGSLYYMLDDFNHNHEHAVIAGSDGVRYSSTHRVARDGQGTWQSIRDKSDQFLESAKNFDFSTGAFVKKNEGTLNQSAKKPKDFSSIVRAQQMLMNEIEFEWLRQWFVQGLRHKSLHNYWHSPIEKLCATFFKLEKATASTLRLLQSQSSADDKRISEQLYDVFIECLSERSKLRKSWAERYKDPVFETIPPDERPMKCSCLDREESTDLDACLKAGQMPESLENLIQQIRAWRSAFVESKQNTGDKSKAASAATKKRKKREAASMTRKEQKRVASNWEMLKRKM